MCEFSHEGSRIELVTEPILAKRFFKLVKSNKLLSLNRKYIFDDKHKQTDPPKLDEDLGFYAYNNNYYHNYNNYYYYNNNNYNNNYYNYDYYDYYIVKGLVKLSGQVVIHGYDGYRAEEIEIVALLSLKDNENKDFLTHFNDKVQKIGDKLNIKILPWQNGEPLPNINGDGDSV